MTTSETKLLVVKSRFLRKQLESYDEVYEEAQNSFAEEYIALTGLEEEASPEEASQEETSPEEKAPSKEKRRKQAKNENNSLEDDIINYSKENKDETLRKLFRKIAFKTHPDKTGEKDSSTGYKNEKLFTAATEALKNNDIMALIDIAEELDIEPPDLSEKHIHMIKSRNLQIGQKIEIMTRTYAWQWFHIEDKERRREILERYAKETINSGP